jgi:hypothetical protein
MMQRVIRWLETHQVECAWKKYVGIDCPGCGIQSAFISLLKGDLVESITTFPALIPMLIMLLLLSVHLLFKLPKGAFILKFLFIFTSSLMVIAYIIKLFNH